ncbi:class I SAM-dependent methyltransferase [Alicyclobacillus fodiniaquatilis]|uniref:Class I SAM-dependent methyltransferase n=1 Tax=Alicyclobacillus fodiniaquatilis TaxID=1661150 RepID=A0ABW4JR02_9BACL
MSISKEELTKRVSEIANENGFVQGWLHNDAGAFLYQLARINAPIPTVVELGSWKGRSTSWLASAIKDRGEGKVYAVDTWDGTPGELEHVQLLDGYNEDQLFDEFKENMEKLNLLAHVEPLRMNTIAGAKHWLNVYDGQPIGLLFIDAGHDFEDVLKDFEFWSPFVVKDGFIVFDDVPGWPGPTKVAFSLPKWYKNIGTTPNNVAFKKIV